MRNAKYTVKSTTQFKKGCKLSMRCGLDIRLLEDATANLATGIPLPEKNRDHALSGNWAGHRECHVLPDWLLVCCVDDDVLVLTLFRTGAHSDLLGKLSLPAAVQGVPCMALFLLGYWHIFRNPFKFDAE